MFIPYICLQLLIHNWYQLKMDLFQLWSRSQITEAENVSHFIEDENHFSENMENNFYLFPLFSFVFLSLYLYLSLFILLYFLSLYFSLFLSLSLSLCLYYSSFSLFLLLILFIFPRYQSRQQYYNLLKHKDYVWRIQQVGPTHLTHLTHLTHIIHPNFYTHLIQITHPTHLTSIQELTTMLCSSQAQRPGRADPTSRT
jgi:hypothetical protein